jgi:hypothetical protein
MFASWSLPTKASTYYITIRTIVTTIIIIIIVNINVVIRVTIHNFGSETNLYLLALWFQMGLMMTALTDDYGTTLES